MNRAGSGQTVLFHYVGTLDDGTVFDSSAGRDPLQVTVGQNEVIRGVDDALEGMAPGEAKTVTLPAEEAYGPHRPELVLEVEREQLPEGLDLTEGNLLETVDSAGRRVQLTIAEVRDDAVKLDANHPLAGQDLTFELQLVEIV